MYSPDASARLVAQTNDANVSNKDEIAGQAVSVWTVWIHQVITYMLLNCDEEIYDEETDEIMNQVFGPESDNEELFV